MFFPVFNPYACALFLFRVLQHYFQFGKFWVLATPLARRTRRPCGLILPELYSCISIFALS